MIFFGPTVPGHDHKIGHGVFHTFSSLLLSVVHIRYGKLSDINGELSKM
jgi:hypothetical protein